MASSFTTTSSLFLMFSILTVVLACSANAQLTPNFYARTCPNVQTIVRNAMAQAVRREARMGASILRLFFHDCFVNGCDASILLDDTATFTGEKTARPNQNSIRGYEVIDAIKSRVEASCNATVSCADILALAARDGVVLLGGPSWTVPLGRKDARTTSLSDANNGQLPSPFANLATLISTFSAKGLNARDMTALSGGHVIGLARCATFRSRIYNDTNINSAFATTRRANCPVSGGDNNLAPFDQTPNQFDNNYYRNLVLRRGLLHSDQELFNNGSQDALVRTYSNNYRAFASDFAVAMVKMGNISPLTGTQGEIRRNCRVVN